MELEQENSIEFVRHLLCHSMGEGRTCFCASIEKLIYVTIQFMRLVTVIEGERLDQESKLILLRRTSREFNVLISVTTEQLEGMFDPNSSTGPSVSLIITALPLAALLILPLTLPCETKPNFLSIELSSPIDPFHCGVARPRPKCKRQFASVCIVDDLFRQRHNFRELLSHHLSLDAFGLIGIRRASAFHRLSNKSVRNAL